MTGSSTDFKLLAAQVEALTSERTHWVATLANTSALLAQELGGINWVGFYLRGDYMDASLPADELVLGPFQGKVACTRIAWGKGVCGTAAQRDRTMRVDDVHSFAGHIACDAASASEVVVPLHAEGRVVGVLDIDSPLPARFSKADQAGLELVADIVEEALQNPPTA